MKKEIRFYLSAQDLREMFKKFDIEGRDGAEDVENVIEHLNKFGFAETGATADNIAEFADIMENRLVYHGGCRVYRPEAEYLLLNFAARAYIVNSKGKGEKNKKGAASRETRN